MTNSAAKQLSIVCFIDALGWEELRGSMERAYREYLFKKVISSSLAQTLAASLSISWGTGL